MDATELRALQAPLKERYKETPEPVLIAGFSKRAPDGFAHHSRHQFLDLVQHHRRRLIKADGQ